MSKARDKVLVIAAGLKGGTAKSTTMSIVDSWYNHCVGLTPRCFDMDPGGTFRSLTAAHSPYFDGENQKSTEAKFDMKMITDSLVDEYDKSVYLIDMPSSSLDKVEDSFSIVNWQDLETNYNLQVVIITIMTADRESTKMVDDWKRMIPNASVVTVVNTMNGEVDAPEDEVTIPFPLHTGKSTDGRSDSDAKRFIDAVKKYKWNWAYIAIPFTSRYVNYLGRCKSNDVTTLDLVSTRRDYSMAVNKRFWGNIVASSFGAKLDLFYNGLDKHSDLLLPDGFFSSSFNTEPSFVDTIVEHMHKFSSIMSFDSFDKASPDAMGEDAIAKSSEFYEEMLEAEEEL